MKYLDKVKLISDDERYTKKGVAKGRTGTIISPEIRYGLFDVVFEFPFEKMNIKEIGGVITGTGEDIFMGVKIQDLELVTASSLTDEQIIEDLPGVNQNWPYKVEDGFIICVDGTKVNKVAFDYGFDDYIKKSDKLHEEIEQNLKKYREKHKIEEQ